MVSSQAWFRTRRNRSGGISLPDMAPFAGLVFLVVCFYFLTNTPRRAEVGIVALEKLPLSNQIICFKGFTLNGSDGAVISLDSENRLSFSLPGFEKEFQAAVISQVAGQQGVHLTSQQQDALRDLPFLATNVQELPSLLAASALNQPPKPGFVNSLSPEQLAACIAVAQKSLLSSKQQHYFRWYLKIATDVKAPQVFHLTDLLQAQGINRYHLLTRSTERY